MHFGFKIPYIWYIYKSKLKQHNITLVPSKLDQSVKWRVDFQTWQCGHLSYGGKSILVNTSLTSIPMNMMRFYYLHEGTHQQLDSLRGRFFWQGVGNNEKYRALKWKVLGWPKEYCGVEFLETRVMNVALLTKRIYGTEKGEQSICISILSKKWTIKVCSAKE
jgi:hypothetical protein